LAAALALVVSATASGADRPGDVTGAGRQVSAAAARADARPVVPPPSGPMPSWVDRVRRDLPQEARPTATGFVVENPRYRATFTAGAFTFVPKHRGVGQAQQAWQYRAAALDLGQQTVALSAVAPSASGHIVEYRRPGVIERYVALPEGVEQVFVIGARPGPGADLVVAGRVTVNGAGRVSDGVLTFDIPDAADLTYSRPVAFDATGTRLAVQTEYEGGELRLRVAGAALRDAVFPVTIDPILRDAEDTYSLVDVSMDATVAYNSRLGEYLIVWSAGDTGGPYQLRAKRFTAAGGGIAGSVALTTPAAGETDYEPSVAYDEFSDRYFVAYSHAGTTLVARGLVLNGTGDVVVAPFALSASTATHWSYGARVASRMQTAPGRDTGRFMAVWVEYPIGEPNNRRLMRERYTASGVGSNDIAINGESASASEPDIAYDFVADTFLIVWVDSDTTVKAIAHDGDSGSQGIAFDITISAVNPDVPAVTYDPGSNRYLVVWEDDRGGTLNNIYGQLVVGGATPSAIGGDILVDSNAGDFPNRRPEVSAETGGFLVAYDRPTGGTGSATDSDTDIYVTYVTAQGAVSTTGLGTVTFDEGVAPANNDEEPFLATGHHGFSFMAFDKDRPDPGNHQLVYMMLLGRYTHYAHGTGGNAGGDAGGDLYLFRPSNGNWYYRTSAGGGSAAWGTAGDIPVLFDLDGDGHGDLGLFRPSAGTWFMKNVITGAQSAVAWGTAGDIPVPGDYVGSTADDYAVWRPSSGTWFIRDGATGASSSRQFGQWGDVPVPADYNGDGKTDLAVFRPSVGIWYYVNADGTGGNSVAWGTAGDIPMQGNYVSTAAADFTVFRPSTGTWYRRTLAGAGSSRQWGTVGDLPMFLDYDADEELDFVVWRPANGTWYILDDDEVSSTSVQWGGALDVPMGGR
jgi:hypothetical protein